MKRLFHILFGKVSGRFDFFWLGGLAQKSTLPQHRDRDLFLSIKHITVPLRGTVICFILKNKDINLLFPTIPHSYPYS